MYAATRSDMARSSQLGFAVAPIIAAAPSFLQTIGTLFHGGKEPDRIAANQNAEQQALGGNAAALEYLRCRSIQGQTCQIPGFPDPVGGWATDSARADAQRRYNNVVQQLGMQGGGVTGGVTTIPVPGGHSVGVSNSTLLLLGVGAFLLMRRR